MIFDCVLKISNNKTVKEYTVVSKDSYHRNNCLVLHNAKNITVYRNRHYTMMLSDWIGLDLVL